MKHGQTPAIRELVELLHWTSLPFTACEALLRGVLHHSTIVDNDKSAEGPGQRLNASEGLA